MPRHKSIIFSDEEWKKGNWRFVTQKKGDLTEPSGCPMCGNKDIPLIGDGWYCNPDIGGCGWTINGVSYYQGRNSKEAEKNVRKKGS